MDQNTNDNEAVYRRFRSSLSGVTESYFDEDDIIDIFDTAGDFNDDYVRMEALLYAARYYPDSQAMADRRAIFYHSYGDAVRDCYLDDHPEHTSFICSLLRLIAVKPSPQEAVESLERLIRGVGRLDDEEMIQLVDAAAQLDLTDWLVDNMDLLKSKTSYPQTLLYELEIVFENARRFDMCERMLDELTALEPFNCEFWRVQAQNFIEMENFDKARSAIGYALAIDPQDETSRLVMAEICYRQGGADNLREAVSILEPMYEKEPAREDFYRPLMLCYMGLDDKASLAKVVVESQKLNPGDELAAAAYISLMPSDTPRAVSEYMLVGNRTEEDVLSLARTVGEQNPDAAANVLMVYAGSGTLTEGWELLFQMLFNAGRYEDICTLVGSRQEDTLMRDNFTHTMALIFVKSLMQTDRKDDALLYARSWCEAFDTKDTDLEKSVVLRFEAVTAYMRKIIEECNGK